MDRLIIQYRQVNSFIMPFNEFTNVLSYCQVTSVLAKCYVTLQTNNKIINQPIYQSQFKSNHFVIIQNYTMHINHNHSNKTHQLALIDKCTQIIREDRIWLRNLLKANHDDVLYLFRTLPKNVDMKQLQIKLRKFISKAKDKQKHQQLLRFKQNMQLPDFVQVAAQKRHQPHLHTKSQSKLRATLKQSQPNQPKSSFVAKWNNYTHYHPSIHLGENRSNINENRSHINENRSHPNENHSHLANQHSSSHQNSLSSKEWSNNYKPHSFNKSLNGQLSNKLSSKHNSSMTRMSKHNKSATSLNKDKTAIVHSRFQNQQTDEFNQSTKYPFAGRNSAKSLKQLQHKIYEELRQFQHNKAKKQAETLNRSYSQRSVQKPHDKQKQKQKQRQKPHHQTLRQPSNKPSNTAKQMTKQSIDQMLKLKLGNCDYEAYRKSQQTEQNDEESTEYVFREKSASQKKFYDGMFPPIEEQTERDSQSQRYPEQPLRFGMMNNVNGSKQDVNSSKQDVNSSKMDASKQDLEDKHKVTFASFAKASPNQNLKNYQIPDARMITSSTNVHDFNIQSVQPYKAIQNNPFQTTFTHTHYQQPAPQIRISQSVYASAQKNSDVNDNYIESNLHKSILESIQKSRDSFPGKGISSSSQVFEHVDVGTRNLSDFNFISDKSLELPAPKVPAPKVPASISSFQSSLYSSTHDDQCLFTSPELLNECRNFLKKTQQINFENSGLKQMSGSMFQSKFDSPVSSQQKSFKHTFNNLSNTGMISFPQPVTITESITKDFYNSSEARINSLFESKQSSVNKGNQIQFETYSKPEYLGSQNSYNKSDYNESSMKNSEEKNELYGPSSIKREQVNGYNNHSRKASSMKKHSQIEETIALPINPTNQFNFSNDSKRDNQPQPTVTQQGFKTSQFANLVVKGESSRKQPKTEERIENLIELEDLIDRILEANEGNIEVDSTWLKHTINNQHIFDQQMGSVLRTILAQFIQSEVTYNFIQIITCVQHQYKKNSSYQPRKSPSRDIYTFLDIQDKGFITFDDVQNFVTQLQNAGVDHLEEIAQHLEEVFDIADFMGVRQISYVNLYVIKNQDCFEQLWEYLREFQFEISVEDQ